MAAGGMTTIEEGSPARGGNNTVGLIVISLFVLFKIPCHAGCVYFKMQRSELI